MVFDKKKLHALNFNNNHTPAEGEEVNFIQTIGCNLFSIFTHNKEIQ